jgi:hypothetical protein
MQFAQLRILTSCAFTGRTVQSPSSIWHSPAFTGPKAAFRFKGCVRAVLALNYDFADGDAIKSGLGGEHIDSNHRLIYIWACASPQKWRAAGAFGCPRIPFEHTHLNIAALDHKPVIWAIRDTPTNFTTEFLKSCHAAPLDLGPVHVALVASAK